MRLNHFRTLVVAIWLLNVTYSFYPNFLSYLPTGITPYVSWLSTFDDRVVDLLRGHGYGAIYVVPDVLIIVVFGSWLFATIGMFFLQNWGRYLYLGLLAVGFLQMGVSG